MIIDDKTDTGGYDTEWVLVLDDWIDGTGTTPDEVSRSSSPTVAPPPAGWAAWGEWTTGR